MNTEKFTSEMLGYIHEMMGRAIKEAYDEGFRKGGEEMRDRILRAAEAPKAPEQRAIVPHPAQPKETASHARAPRGRVGEVIETVFKLHEYKGLKGATVEKHVVELDDRIARKSVGNELRRFKDKRYRQDKHRYWFLISGNGEKETAGHPTEDRPAVSTHSNNGGSYGTTLV